ncbi:MAG: hypothetical protein OXC44_01000 [Proteobacteria bacterium]|nr:hypothetical protein [Pseudomonadota bacterium]
MDSAEQAIIYLILAKLLFVGSFIFSIFDSYTLKKLKRELKEELKKLKDVNVELSIKNATLASTKNEEHFTQLATTALNNVADEFLKKLDERMNEKEQVIDKTGKPITDQINTLEGTREEAYKSLNQKIEDLKAEISTLKEKEERNG